MRIQTTVDLEFQTDVFQDCSQSYTLTGTPAANTPVSVYLNGLLMLQGLDYALDGSTLTFTGQTIGDSPVIQVQYWKALP